MVTRTQAISYFLNQYTRTDLSALYNPNMEVQVNVAQDNGEVIDGEYMGRKWRGYTDGVVVWKSFRIPHNAWNDPHYEDKELKFSLTQHAEGIGMTGWDWKERKSLWVAFDFDAIIGHSDKHASKLSHDELQRVKDAACAIPWVTVRKSTSGNGLHLYVFLDPVDTANHAEHSSLARAILSYMTTYTGFDFKSKVDICGGNMWVWHRKMQGTDGLMLIKPGDTLYDIPPDWRNHVPVVQGKTSRVINEDRNWLNDDKDTFEQISGSHKHVRLDKFHLELLEWFRDNGKYFWWDSDRHMLVTHVIHLKEAHDVFGYKGVFKTDSKGENPNSHNCFAYPMRNGAWVVRRYGRGVKEHPSWSTDSAGFTMCYLNRAPDLKMAAAAHNGVEDAKGKFIFPYAQDMSDAANLLGADISIPTYMTGRQNTSLKMHKDGRLIIEIERQSTDRYDDMLGWVSDPKKWTKLIEISRIETDHDQPVDTYDDLIRHVVDADGRWSGWYVYANGKWNIENMQTLKTLMSGKGLSTKDINSLLAYHIQLPWVLTIKPFLPEYPGDREWNRDAPRLRFTPSTSEELHYPTWTSILNHVGRALDAPLKESDWAKKNGVVKGADYLKCWIASMIQYPNEPLPYLFLYSDQQATGKSMFHEALALLFHPGYANASVALTNTQQFNGELALAVLCVVEEIDLKSSKVAYNRIKEWVTSIYLPLHAKNETPCFVRNSTHWIQCANSIEYCPIFPGDTRITMIHVPDPPDKFVSKTELTARLEKEAPDFLASILRLELPEPVDRMNVPVIDTPDKLTAADVNRDELDRFLRECVHEIPGHVIAINDLWQHFNAWLDPNVRHKWTKHRMSGRMPLKFPKGRPFGWNTLGFGNLSLEADAEPGIPYVVKDGKLIQEAKNDLRGESVQ